MKMSKKMLSIILALIMTITCTLPVFADTYATSGTCGNNVTWEFDVATRTLTISGEGEMDNGSPWSTYKEIIKTVVIEAGVTTVGIGAFNKHSALQEVSMSDTILEICQASFGNCTSLTDIIIPDSVEYIGNIVFQGCSSLKNITIGNNVKQVGGSAFTHCSSLENVYINNLSNWCEIDIRGYISNPLYYAENLYLNGELVTDLVIPEDVTLINNYAFYNYNKLETVTIHENVSSISDTAFRGCSSLTEINVNENNATYKSVDGVLFSKNMVSLFLYPAQKNVETYTVPNDVLIIEGYSFANCSNLKNIICPVSVASINNAFINCASNINFYYEGTKEQWEEINVGEKECIGTIHYNCTNPEGHYTLTEVVAPTCSNEGYSEYSCPCGYTMEKDYTYIDHQPGEWRVGYNATCTEEGYRYQNCTYCGARLNEETIPATDHKYDAIITTPTCTEKGYTTYTCECGDSYVADYTDATHTFGEWTKVDNRQARTCSTCGYVEYMKVAGDLNGDGYTSAKDARIILQYICGLRMIDSEFTETADTNGDGNITAIDARIVLQMVAGLRDAEEYNIIPDKDSTTEPDDPNAPKLTVVADKTKVKVGETVKATVSVSADSKISSVIVDLVYDEKTFELVSFTKGTTLFQGDNDMVMTNKSYADGKARFIGIAPEDVVTSAGTLFTVELKAIAETDNSTFSLNVTESSTQDNNLDDVDIELATASANVKVVNEEPTTEEPTTEPEEPTTTPSTSGSPRIILSADKTHVNVGDTVTVRVNLAEKSGLCTLTIKADYDKSILKATKMVAGDFGPIVNVNTGIATMATATTYENAGSICTITFEAIKSGEANISFNIHEACDADFNNVSVNINTLNISVGDESTTTPEESTTTSEETTTSPFEPTTNPCENGHIWGEWSVDINATCVNDGRKSRRCIYCSTREKEVIPAIGQHDYQSSVYSPSCTTEGYTEYICTRCGDSYITDYVDATEHNYTWYILNAPKCEEDGAKIGQCTDCEKIIINGIPATGHNYVNGLCVNCSGDSLSDNPTANSPVIKVSSINAIAGSEIKVKISLKNNPGITSAILNVNYDTSKLLLVSVEDCGNLGTAEHSNGLTSPYVLCWTNDTATENIIYNGDVAILTFKILDDAELGDTPIVVSYNYNNCDIVDKDMNPVKFATEDGVVKIIDIIIGDVNSDGRVNQLDRVALTRYLAKWVEYPEGSINSIAADTNCDGKVNQLDRIILTRHLAGWEGYEQIPYVS